MVGTEKQKNILRNAGWDEKDIAVLSYEELSAAIGGVLAEKPKNQYHKEVKAQNVVSEWKPKTDNISYYVAYAKDLCIAMLASHSAAVEGTRNQANPANRIEPIEIGKLMTEAIFEIRKAKMAFEAKQ